MTSDPLHNQGPIQRVNYATGMMLSADDFRAEQTYHRNRLGQILRFALGKGTIAGLAVESEEHRPNPVKDADYTVWVRPGLAIDGLGQLIEVTRDYKISLRRWVETNQAAVSENANGDSLIFDIVLSARDLGRAKTPSFASGAFDALDAVTASRLEDGFLLELVPQKTEPEAAFAAPSTAKPLDQVLQGWTEINAGTLARNQKILLARIRGCKLTKANAVFTLTPGQSLVVDNDVRPIVFLAGRSLAKIPT